jgi:hypothetical protein
MSITAENPEQHFIKATEWACSALGIPDFHAPDSMLAPFLLHVYAPNDVHDELLERVLNYFLGFRCSQIAIMVPGIVPFLVHPADLRRYAANIERIRTLREGEVAALSFRMRDQAGAWHCMQTRHTVLTLGRRPSLVGIAIEALQQGQIHCETGRAGAQLVH